MVAIACSMACGVGERDGSTADTPLQSPPGDGTTGIQPSDPVAVGLFGCGEVAVSADDSVSVGVSLPADLTAEAPVVTVMAMTDSAPPAINGKRLFPDEGVARR
jgi:hypothetical protein